MSSSVGLLEGDKQPRLAEFHGPPRDELHGQQGLAAAGEPQIRVGRPWGRPPLVMSSRPLMPVGHLDN